jgi:hypothetical protein
MAMSTVVAPAVDPPADGDASTTPRRRWLGVCALAALAYLVIGAAFLWPALSSCSSAVFGVRGDATAGGLRLGWTYQQLGGGPFTGWTTWTAAPGGEPFWSPHWWTAATVFVPLWALTTVTSAACAWNLMLLVGLVTSAMGAFLLAAAVVRHRGVAFVGGLAWGYAASVQTWALGQIGYVHAAVLAYTALAVLALWQRPTRRRAVVAGAVLALGAYTDPYYLLMVPLVAVAVLVGLLLARRGTGPSPLRRARRRAVLGALAVAAVGVVPLAATLVPNLGAGAEMARRAEAGTGEGDLDGQGAYTWSASVTDYLLWPTTHPVLGDVAAGWRAENLRGGWWEKTLTIGFGVMGLAIGGTVIGRRRRPDDSTPLGLDLRSATTAMVAVVVTGAVWSLAPGSVILAPLFDAVPFWRVFARFALVTQLGAAVLASIGLAAVVARLRRPPWRAGAVVLAAVVVGFESLTVPTAPTFDLRAAPAGYRWLAEQGDVSTIAEYPLDSPRRTPHNPFLSFQPVHGKRLLNASVPAAPSVPLQEAIYGLGDPQTPGVLRALGIDRVVLHRLLYPGRAATGPLPPGYRLVRSDVTDTTGPAALALVYDSTEILALEPDVAPAEAALTVLGGFGPPEARGWESSAWARGSGTLGVVDLGAADSRVSASFALRSGGDAIEVVVRDGDGERWRGRIARDAVVPVVFETTVGTRIEIEVLDRSPGTPEVGVQALLARPVR